LPISSSIASDTVTPDMLAAYFSVSQGVDHLQDDPFRVYQV
jgi:hypothetical protein